MKTLLNVSSRSSRTRVRPALLSACLLTSMALSTSVFAAGSFAEDLNHQPVDAPGCCDSEVVAELGFAATETGPFLSFGDAEQVFHAASDLDGESIKTVSLVNPYADRAVTVQVRSIDGDGAAQTFAVELAPSADAALALPAESRRVLATSLNAFDLELEDASTGLVVEPELRAARTGRNPRTNKTAAGSSSLTKSTHCQGQWTLTCQSGGCAGLGPFTHEGRVEVDTISFGGPTRTFHFVYWNLNTPTGDFTTTTPSGLTATWDAWGGICPVEVTNSLGHTYTVTR